MVTHVNYMQIVGPAKFYCIADGCTNFMTDDGLWCDFHLRARQNFGSDPTVKNGLSKEYFQQLIRDTRAQEKRQEQVRATVAVTTTAVQAQTLSDAGVQAKTDRAELEYVKALLQTRTEQLRRRDEEIVEQAERQKRLLRQLQETADAKEVVLRKAHDAWVDSVKQKLQDVMSHIG